IVRGLDGIVVVAGPTGGKALVAESHVALIGIVDAKRDVAVLRIERQRIANTCGEVMLGRTRSHVQRTEHRPGGSRGATVTGSQTCRSLLVLVIGIGVPQI